MIFKQYRNKFKLINWDAISIESSHIEIINRVEVYCFEYGDTGGWLDASGRDTKTYYE